VRRRRDRVRLWNRANVACLSLRGTSEAQASEILEAWFATVYHPNPEDDACLDEVRQLEDDYRKPAPPLAGRAARRKPKPQTG